MSLREDRMLDRFFRRFTPNARPHLLLDYDGTLAGFRVDRFQSKPWAGVGAILKQIQQQGQTRMAIITGRPAAEIAPMLALDSPLEVWGLHGAERLYPDGRRELEATPAQQHTLDKLKEQLRQDSFGGLLEEKANGAVMHWRGASPRHAKQIEQRTRALFEPHAQINGLRLLDFDGGLELRAGRDKGGAVRAILSESANPGPVAYLGDDLSDEAAFEAVNELPAGLSVLVRRKPRPTVAQLWLKPPSELREFLARWAEAVNSLPPGL